MNTIAGSHSNMPVSAAAGTPSSLKGTGTAPSVERRYSGSAAGTTTPGHGFSNNPYGPAEIIGASDVPTPSAGRRNLSPQGSTTTPLHDADDTSEITSLFTTFDPTAGQANHVHASSGAYGVGGMDNSFMRLQQQQRASLNRSHSLGNSMTHSPYAPVTEEGLRARQLYQQQQQQQQQQNMHHSQEFHTGSYGAAPTPLNASTFEYGAGVSGFSRFNGSTSQADMNPLAFNFDHSDGALRTPISAGGSSSDVAMLVDVYENDTITVSVKQRTGPSQRANGSRNDSRSSSLNGSSVAIQQMAESAEKAVPAVHTHMKSPSASFHAGHQHFVPSANSLHHSNATTPRHPAAIAPPYHGGPTNPALHTVNHAAQHPFNAGAGPLSYPSNPYAQPPQPQQQNMAPAAISPMHMDPRAGPNYNPPPPPAPMVLPVVRGGAPVSPHAVVLNSTPQAVATPNVLSRRRSVASQESQGTPTSARGQPVRGATASATGASVASQDGVNTASTPPSSHSGRVSVPKTAIAEHAERRLPVMCFVVVKGKHDGHRYASTQPQAELPPIGSHVIVEGDRGEDIGVLSSVISVPDMIANCIGLHRLRQEDQQRRAARMTEKALRGDAVEEDAAGGQRGGEEQEDGEKTRASATPASPVVSDTTTVAPDASGQAEQITSLVFTYKAWPYYLRPATEAETAQLPTLRAEEKEAFDTASTVVTHFVSVAFQQALNRQQKTAKEEASAEGEKSTIAGAAEQDTAVDVHRPSPADPAEVKLVDCEYQLDRKKLTLFVVRPSRQVFVDFRRMQRKLFRSFHCRIWFVYMDEVSEDSDAVAAVAHQLQRPSTEK